MNIQDGRAAASDPNAAAVIKLDDTNMKVLRVYCSVKKLL